MSGPADLEAARETVRWAEGIFVGLLDEDEIEALGILEAAGEARRSYEGSAGFFGLAKVRLSRHPTEDR